MVERRERRMAEISDLEAKILLMRRMGVEECDGIRLGPAPQAPPAEETKEQYDLRCNKEAQRRHDIMFAASGTRPRVRLVK